MAIKLKHLSYVPLVVLVVCLGWFRMPSKVGNPPMLYSKEFSGFRYIHTGYTDPFTLPSKSSFICCKIGFPYDHTVVDISRTANKSWYLKLDTLALVIDISPALVLWIVILILKKSLLKKSV